MKKNNVLFAMCCVVLGSIYSTGGLKSTLKYKPNTTDRERKHSCVNKNPYSKKPDLNQKKKEKRQTSNRQKDRNNKYTRLTAYLCNN